MPKLHSRSTCSFTGQHDDKSDWVSFSSLTTGERTVYYSLTVLESYPLQQLLFCCPWVNKKVFLACSLWSHCKYSFVVFKYVLCLWFLGFWGLFSLTPNTISLHLFLCFLNLGFLQFPLHLPHTPRLQPGPLTPCLRYCHHSLWLTLEHGHLRKDKALVLCLLFTLSFLFIVSESSFSVYSISLNSCQSSCITVQYNVSSLQTVSLVAVPGSSRISDVLPLTSFWLFDSFSPTHT